MKALLLLLTFSFSSLTLISQDHIKPFKLNEDGILYYDLIYENKELSKEDLYSRSKIWIAKIFVDGKEVEMHSDKEEGTIIGKGTVRLKSDFFGSIGGNQDYLRYTINIFCKNGKARIIIDNIGSVTIGNQFIDPKSVIYLEKQYWVGGNIDKKIRTGFKADKAKKAKAIQNLADSWQNAIVKTAEYSDF